MRCESGIHRVPAASAALPAAAAVTQLAGWCQHFTAVLKHAAAAATHARTVSFTTTAPVAKMLAHFPPPRPVSCRARLTATHGHGAVLADQVALRTALGP